MADIVTDIFQQYLLSNESAGENVLTKSKDDTKKNDEKEQ